MTPAWMDVGAFGVGHVARWNGREGDIEWFVDREPSLHTTTRCALCGNERGRGGDL